MADLSAFPITARWPAQHPDRLQLYSFPTPNGVKVSIMLEETGLAYEPHLIKIMANESHDPAFLSLNPNGKIPAILDPDGPGGQPFVLFESGAILLYLANKSGLFLSSDPAKRFQTIQWLMFQMGGVGPMFGQMGFFVKFAGSQWEDKRPQERFVAEVKRILGVMDTVLAGQSWFMGDDYTIADISMIGWVRAIDAFYGAGELVGLADFANVTAWLERALARPAVQRGLGIPAMA
ncbi:MAG: glutathione S-transferase N-terminal domain-containing protein [Sphingomonas sp.]|uniref:glutathione S-transferase N-terminal domain-containing protein n=1 Tax=Sphingomonas sp. TaxID=28214 RepID=UPI0035A873FF|nr:glutathione S-transferase N-terminal domain-containing protein [Sphingomonas sp.]